MSYESEERLMVQGIENDARRWPEHGEIPPTHDELVKIKQNNERQKMLDEDVHTSCFGCRWYNEYHKYTEKCRACQDGTPQFCNWQSKVNQ